MFEKLIQANVVAGGVTGEQGIPSPPFPSFLLPSLRSRLPKIHLGGLGKRYKLPQRVWGTAPADKRFGAF